MSQITAKDIAEIIKTKENLQALEEFLYPFYRVGDLWDKDDNFKGQFRDAESIDVNGVPFEHIGIQYVARKKAQDLINTAVQDIAKELKNKEKDSKGEKQKVNENV